MHPVVIGNTISSAKAYSIACLAFDPPTKPTYDTTNKWYQQIPYRQGQEKLALGVFRCAKKSNSIDRRVGLFFHGNGDDLGKCEPYCTWLAESLGMDIVAIDYPGYGHSTGELNEQSVFETALLAYRYCRDHMGAKNLVLIGKSLGTGPAVYLTSHQMIKDNKIVTGCVLISPFASGFRCLKTINTYLPESNKRFWDMQFMPSYEFIKTAEVPVKILHGINDTVIPVENAYMLHKHIPLAYRYDPTLFPFCGHNDIESKNKVKFLTDILSFLNEIELEQD